MGKKEPKGPYLIKPVKQVSKSPNDKNSENSNNRNNNNNEEITEKNNEASKNLFLEPKIPTNKPTSPTEAKFFEMLEGFCKLSVSETLPFEQLQSEERKIVHHLAETFQLEHISSGKGEARCLTISRKKLKRDEWILNRYLGLFGEVVESKVRDLDLDAVDIPNKAVEMKAMRDGNIFHITLIGPQELEKIEKTDAIANGIQYYHEKVPEMLSADYKAPSQLHKLIDLVEAVLDASDLTDLGVGMLEEATKSNKAWFKVIEWPSATEFRKALGLPPHDFHITLGFLKSDIHNRPKNATTLLKKSPASDPKSEKE